MKQAEQSLLATLHWDEDLNAYREENGKVLGVKCGLLTVDETALEQGETYYRLISATFIDEVAAQGKHVVTVDVLDENGYRLNGAIVEHGWPYEVYPAHDGLVEAAVYGATLAEWGLYADYNPLAVQYGPYWVRVKGGNSDVFFGMGLPYKRHVSYTAVYQRMTVGAGDPGSGTSGNCDDVAQAVNALTARFNEVFR